METKPLRRRILSKQWSFFWAGIGFGIAQIVYMVVLWVGSWGKGKDAVSKPITVTTDLLGLFNIPGAVFRYRHLWRDLQPGKPATR